MPVDHPSVSRVLRLGENGRETLLCRNCGEIAEYERDGECLCRDCALDRWYLLPAEKRLALLGFEPAEL